MGIILFLAIPVLALVYLGWHLWCLLPLAALWKTAVISLGIMSFLLLFLVFSGISDRLPLTLASTLYEIGTSSLVIMLYMVMAFLVLDVGRLLHVVPKAWLYANWWMAGGLFVLLSGLFLYGNLHYRDKVRQPLELTTGKSLQRQQKIVMISDLHLGYHNRRAELHRWIDMVNREQPDVVLIAGDIIDMSLRPLMEEDMAGEFRRLKAPVYACLGNHEYFCNRQAARAFFREAGICLLVDSVATVGDLQIVGRDDRTNAQRAALDRLMEGVDKEKYTIVLDHQPYHLEQAEQAGADFQLSGHTHHGQVWPGSLITGLIYECAFGPWQRGNTRYYVSSGLGIWGGKFRIGTRSEYIVATLKNG